MSVGNVEDLFETEDGACTIIYKATVADNAKAGSTLTNTATFTGMDMDDSLSDSATASITVVGGGGGDDEDVDGDGDGSDGDKDKATKKSGLDHSPDCGDHSLDILMIFCPILWVL